MARYFKDEYPFLDTCLCYEGNNWNNDEDVVKSEQLLVQYQDLVKRSATIIPKLDIYFGARLHDSWIMDIVSTDSTLKIRLNDFSSHCFTDALNDEFGLKTRHKERKLPVTILFENISECTLSFIKKNGKIIPVSKNRYWGTLKEYLYDELKTIDHNGIAGGILFSSDSYKSTLLFEFTAKRIAFEENQEKAFRALFGESMIEYWKSYWEKKVKGAATGGKMV